jgi:hypothetical protein
MRRILIPAVLLGAVLPVLAQNMVLYDDFTKGRVINREKWIGQEWGTFGAGEAIRELVGGKLRLMHRVYGRGEQGNSGRARGGNRVYMVPNGGPTAIRAIDATFVVNSYELAACQATPFNLDPNPAPAAAGVTVQGFFFNAGFGSGGNQGDIAVGVRVERSSASTADPRLLDVTPIAGVCVNADCSAGTPLTPPPPEWGVPSSLGTVSLTQRFTVGVTWDDVAKQFRFRLNGNEFTTIPYAPGDYSEPPARRPDRFIEVSNLAPNCRGFRTTAAMDAAVVSVSVNP